MTKELESLEMLKNITIINFEDENGIKRIVFANEVYKEQFDIIETALKDYDMLLEEYNLMKKEYESDKKKIKALEIIKEKECLFKGLSETTQEEFDLLKEVLL